MALRERYAAHGCGPWHKMPEQKSHEQRLNDEKRTEMDRVGFRHRHLRYVAFTMGPRWHGHHECHADREQTTGTPAR